ncbi:MAG: hypothetical protein LBF72_00460 [Holosporales bacterium]|jgi:hypothetical protein|nr:hypothetical protein [Holosporales bacterium]
MKVSRMILFFGAVSALTSYSVNATAVPPSPGQERINKDRQNRQIRNFDRSSLRKGETHIKDGLYHQVDKKVHVATMRYDDAFHRLGGWTSNSEAVSVLYDTVEALMNLLYVAQVRNYQIDIVLIIDQLISATDDYMRDHVQPLLGNQGIQNMVRPAQSGQGVTRAR